MGAKQSKRSVDISGKEAESAGEVAAAGAGGEGRVEQLADADALKPQLNGDAHIEPTENEKQADSGTPENEKDATTEKESKEQEEKKEADAVINGDSEPKAENGDSPQPEENKKPKKEKVKKKWSLRSISFSRKDKPKQEKKQKEEEKTNGEPEKVPEEVADAIPENDNKETEEKEKPPVEVKDDKTPETPVTEPITNGTITPDTSKVETPVEESTEIKTGSDKTDLKIEPEQLPVNGLSLEDSKNEVSESVKIEPSKPEESSIESPVPATEIPVKNEVCVEQMPLIEPTPPPLPATPPPSSVASFAATTMAPESTNASFANNSDTVINSTIVLDTNTDIPAKELNIDIECPNNQPKDEFKSLPSAIINSNETPEEPIISQSHTNTDLIEETSVDMSAAVVTSNEPIDIHTANDQEICNVDKPESMAVQSVPEVTKPTYNDDATSPITIESDSKTEDEKTEAAKKNEILNAMDVVLNDNEKDSTEIENLKNKSKDTQGNLIKTAEFNGNLKEETILVNGETVTDDLVESNAATTPEDSMPPSLSEAMDTLPPCSGDLMCNNDNDASESFPLPPSELCPSESEISQPGTPERNGDAPTNNSQEPLIVADKMAELIPDVLVPELSTELEKTTDVEVAQ